MAEQIEILSSAQINHEKWDDCIRHNSNGVIYARSFYLDHLADNWHGVVKNDYEAVMPIPWRKKYGIRYSYDVPFTQQLGCFSTVENKLYREMLRAFFGMVRYGDYSFNYANERPQGAAVRSNFILQLSRPYESIVSGYKKDLLRNLRKVSNLKFIYAEEKVEVAVRLYQDMYASRTPHVTAGSYDRFLLLCKLLEKESNALARKIADDKNETLAVVLLLRDQGRLYNMMNSTTTAGRKTEANHLLFDKIFSEFAGQEILFDFEGSDIPGIKTFYEKFGATDQPYSTLHFNYLGFPLRLFRR